MTFLQFAIYLLQTYRYQFVFPMAILEGPILGVLCGFLLRLGFFDFWRIYLLLILGDLIGDLIWYGIGYHTARPLIRRYGHFVSLNVANMEKIEKKFKRNEAKTILISKMSNGFGFAILMLTTAGALKVPLKKFMILNTIGGFFWTGLLLTIGYFFGHLYTFINKGFEVAFIIFISVIVIAMLYGFQRYARKTVMIDKV